MRRTYFILTLLIAATGLLAGCASSQSTSVPASQAEPEVVELEVPEGFDGDGLGLTVDGSSVASFDASMALIKKHTDEASYKSLDGAVGYLLLYDLEARGKKEVLYRKLDGKTGYEIMGMVNWRKPPPEKSPAEEGAADAKIIDT